MSIQSSTLDPEEDMIKKQKETLMRVIVTQLKPRYRALIELRYFREYSYEEIAQEMDLPLGTVKAQLFRARELLYNILNSSEGKI
jgi:RNA polymerase sigma-70 factor (ECF subfamily)